MPQPFVTTEYRVPAPALTQPIRIALVADLHERKADDILRRLRLSKPDCIAVAGDVLERKTGSYDGEFRNFLFKRILFNAAHLSNELCGLIAGKRNRPDPENAFRFLRGAAAVAPVFVSLGNHEEELEPEDREFFREHRITVLDNSEAVFRKNGQTIWFGGLSPRADADWLERFAGHTPYTVLLCHFPEYYDKYVRRLPICLTLSGHNHGGQVRLFGRGLLSTTTGFFPKYDRGFYDNRLIVTAGCSNTAALPRLNNPRELVIVNLIPK